MKAKGLRKAAALTLAFLWACAPAASAAQAIVSPAAFHTQPLTSFTALSLWNELSGLSGDLRSHLDGRKPTTLAELEARLTAIDARLEGMSLSPAEGKILRDEADKLRGILAQARPGASPKATTASGRNSATARPRAGHDAP